MKGGSFFLHGLPSILAKTGLSKDGHRRPQPRPGGEEGLEEHD